MTTLKPVSEVVDGVKKRVNHFLDLIERASKGDKSAIIEAGNLPDRYIQGYLENTLTTRDTAYRQMVWDLAETEKIKAEILTEFQATKNAILTDFQAKLLELGNDDV